MSSRELDERNEKDQEAAVADAIGLSVDDLRQLEWSIQDNASNDGLIYGHAVYFSEGSDPTILAKIDGLNNGEWVSIDPLY
ncbi:MAG: hypothetical protein P1U83_18410 [Roseovarius sp.]|nr:hypothetical protein [Roseovarius sp.]